MSSYLQNAARRDPGSTVVVAVLVAGLMTLPVTADDGGIHGKWKDQGPGPIQFAQVESITPNDEAVGAIHTVAAHPTNRKILFVGSVNGGIWRTGQAHKAQPKWKQQTDDQASSTIGALEFDPTDNKHRTLVAGIGRYSSFGRLGQDRIGLLRTTNGGKTWTVVDGGGTLFGKNISGVAPRGSTITVSVDIADAFTFGNIGIWRSTDTGATFGQISGALGSGLPPGVTNDLVGDPNNPARLWTSVLFADFVSGANGFYRSDDAGATWIKVSNLAIDALLISGTTNNVEFAVGQSGEVYGAIVNGGRLAGLFRSGNAGATWASLDLPATGLSNVGIHPGGQGSIHMSIVADPHNSQLVYVGGDRQPFLPEEGFPGFFPNTIGANNFSGRLFRVDASQPSGSQATPITHPTTTLNSSPHADSREMIFSLDGDIIQVDDGGIYRRTNPSGIGDWFSLNGSIQTNEQHNVSYDTVSNIVFAGTQDNDSPIQNAPGDVNWENLLSGDGGDTAVDDYSTAGTSTRYNSAQFLQAFIRSFWDTGNNLTGFVFPALTVVSGAPFVGQFATPIELNSIDPSRIAIGGGNSLYESFDQGDTLVEEGVGIAANGTGFDAIAYGGLGNPDLLVVGSGDQLFLRSGAPPGSSLSLVASYPRNGSGLTIRDIVIDPDDANSIFLANRTEVWQTTDGGATWNDVSGNIQSFDPKFLRAITYVDGEIDDDEDSDSDSDSGGSIGTGDGLVVSSFNGIFVSRESTGFTVWAPLGKGIPRAPVMDLDYDAEDGLVVAGLLGRGSWSLDLDGDSDSDSDDDSD